MRKNSALVANLTVNGGGSVTKYEFSWGYSKILPYDAAFSVKDSITWSLAQELGDARSFSMSAKRKKARL